MEIMKEKWSLDDLFGSNVVYNFDEYFIDFCGDQLSIFASVEEISKLAIKIYEEEQEEYLIEYSDVENFINEHIKNMKCEFIEKNVMDLDDYVKKWNRSGDNNFASSCYNDNRTASELKDAVKNGTEEESTMKTWQINKKEWLDAVLAAIYEKESNS